MKALALLLLLLGLLAGCATTSGQPRQIILLCPIEGSYLLSDLEPPTFEHKTINGKDTTFMIEVKYCPVCGRDYYTTNQVNF
jgi:hypothetical protein